MSHLPVIRRAQQHGSRIAIRSGGHAATYRELLDASADIACHLLGDRSDLDEARVAMLVSPGSDYVASLWGIWRAGGIAVPLSLAAAGKELRYTLADSGASVVIVEEALAGRIAPLAEELGLRLVLSGGREASGTRELPEVGPQRRAMILYTSGTTSTPKGVVTTHECITAQITALIDAWAWQDDDRIPLFLPLHHIHGIINILSCGLWIGSEVECFSRFERETILERVAAGRYTLFMAVPTIYVKLIEAIEDMAAEQRTAVVAGFAALRLMVSGSAALPASVHEQWQALTGQRLLERYGMTEIGMALSNPYRGERRPGAVGQPLPGVEVRLVGEDGGVVDEEGTAGEIQVRGPNVFLEYWERPEATKDSFNAGWFLTGDIAVREDGSYRILGRSSVDIIKSGGYKLSALEIEACLLDHPAIAECAVVGLPDATWGERVAVAIVSSPGCTLTAEELRAWCDGRVSAYKIPRQLIAVDSLPRNAMGKVTKPSVVTLFQVE